MCSAKGLPARLLAPMPRGTKDMDSGREWARTVDCIDERSSLRVLLLVHESTHGLLEVLVHANPDRILQGLGQLSNSNPYEPIRPRFAAKPTDGEE